MSEPYQDIYQDGEILAAGLNPSCPDRYAVLEPYLRRFKRRFSLIDLGCDQGYFALRTLDEFDSVAVLLEGDWRKQRSLVARLKKAASRDRFCFLRHKLTNEKIARLAECEHFDVVLALNVAHHLEDITGVIESLLDLGSLVVIEVPSPADEGACNPQTTARLKAQLDAAGGSPDIYRTARHTSAEPGFLYVFDRTGRTKSLRRPYYHVEDRAAPAEIDHIRIRSDWASSDKEDLKRQQVRPFIPGLNLRTFLLMGGQLPERESIVDALERRLISNHDPARIHGDIRPWNIVLSGAALHLIDSEDPRNSSLETDNRGFSRTVRMIRNPRIMEQGQAGWPGRLASLAMTLVSAIAYAGRRLALRLRS
ncbi:hypothetical protein CSC94_17625 [Zhengella mangrovi]|uniref:Methyltransferase domain-containing protein n=1 Tax=Zhengella mangrovi TaxID=1982044 RepID=A0A2G1QKD5_9HYPH|nr:class I SAM-dependent methyltransferase [Zhengella mangrovi]PHP65668.1 hypothetical protein CSC94_17625 [Zhengella mangrovi]